MARQRHAVPLEQPNRLRLGQARAQPEQQVTHALRRLAGRVLERGELLHLVDDAEAVARVDQEAGGVAHRASGADQSPQLVHEERRRLDRVRRGVGLPADHADLRPGTNPFLTEELGQRPRTVARLARQTEILEPVAPHRERRRAGGPPVLVAHEDGWLAGLADDEDRFLEARVEARQIRQVRAVLAIGVDDQAVDFGRRRTGPQAFQPVGVERRGQLRRLVGHAEFGQVDRREPGPGHGRLHGVTSPVPRSSVTYWSAATGIHGPCSPSGQVTRTSARSAAPSPKWVGPSRPLTWPPPTVTSRSIVVSPALTSIHEPIASLFGPGSLSWTPSQWPIAGLSEAPDPVFRQIRTGRRS